MSATIDPNNLNQEFVELPAEVARIGQLYADSLLEEANAEERLLVAEAEESEKARATLGPKATETAIKQAVTTTPQIQLLRREVREAHHRKNSQRQALDALAVKKDCLISLGAQLRLEMTTLDPTIRQRG